MFGVANFFFSFKSLLKNNIFFPETAGNNLKNFPLGKFLL